MSDSKFFARGKVQELRQDLIDDGKKDPKFTKKRSALKKVVANMTMGNDMSALFPDVMSCMQIPDIEIKKMVYLYLINYAKVKPELVLMAVNSFLKDAADSNPLIRALAIRTMAYVHVDKVIDCLCEPVRACVKDKDPYVRKTAAICIPKIYFYSPELAQSEGLIEALKQLLYDSNATVVASALAGLVELHEKSDEFDLHIDMSTASTLITALEDCSEWCQIYILEALMFVLPGAAGDAESLIDRLYPRLQHSNSGVVLATTKLIVYFLNYVEDENYVDTAYQKLAPPLVTLTSGEPELQYVALRNIILIVQKRPEILKNDMKVFFCKYNDPIYVKLSKLEIMFHLANANNVDMMLSELKEYSTEVDVDFVRKSVRSIGRCAIKIDSCADRCIQALVELIQTKVNYVVQEAIVVIRDIFRKFPNRYESIISILCENLDNLDEPEAKASMIWIIGQYADRIENSADLLESFIETFLEEPAEIQLAILTSTVKLFIKRPSQGKDLVPKVLKWATEEMDNPDVRDRGFIYWRLLSTDPMAAKAIILSDQTQTINTDTDNMDPVLLNEMLLYIDSLVSIQHKPQQHLFKKLKQRRIMPSAALSSRGKLVAAGLPGKAGPAANGGDSHNSRHASVQYQSDPYGTEVANRKVAMNLLDLDTVDEQQPSYGQSELPTQYGGGNVLDQLGGLSLGVTPASSVVGYVAPKTTLLRPNMAKGMEIEGTFARRNGLLMLEMTIHNRALQPLSDFMIQFNKNTYGFAPGTFNVRSPLPSNQSAESALELFLNIPSRQPTTPVNSLHIAVKNNVGVFFFQCEYPLHILFDEEGQMVQSDFLSVWRECESTSATKVVEGLVYPDIDAIRNKLALNNIFTVAERQVDSKTVLYASSKVVEDYVTVEIQALERNGNIVSCGLLARARKQELVEPYLKALNDIIKGN
eukprot:Partr_v1_DN28307_c1_g1_i2_m79180 putative Adaptor-related protein complex